MSTLRVNSLLNAAGTDTPAIDGLAKAWVKFNGTGTVAISGSFNVSTITDLGNGHYQVNFTNAMPDTNYAVVMYNNANSTTSNPFALGNQYAGGMGNFTTSSVQMTSYSAGFVDSGIFSVAIFR